MGDRKNLSINKSWDEKPYNNSAYATIPGDNSFDTILNITSGGPGEAQIWSANINASVLKNH